MSRNYLKCEHFGDESCDNCYSMGDVIEKGLTVSRVFFLDGIYSPREVAQERIYKGKLN